MNHVVCVSKDFELHLLAARYELELKVGMEDRMKLL